MTKEEAFDILKEHCEPVIKDGITYFKEIGDFRVETPDSFNWTVFLYTSEMPYNPDYAFVFYVNKATKAVSHSSIPLNDKEIEKIWKGKVPGAKVGL